MELKDAKRLIAYAKKNGAKSIKCGDIEVVFGDVSPAYRPTSLGSQPEKDDPNTVPVTPEPTLQQINDYIYSNVDEQH